MCVCVCVYIQCSNCCCASLQIQSNLMRFSAQLQLVRAVPAPLSLSLSTGFQCVVHFQHVCLGGRHTHSSTTCEHGFICGIHAAIELVHHIEDNETNDQHQQRHKDVGQHQRRIWYGIQHCCNFEYYERRNYDSFQTERVSEWERENCEEVSAVRVRRTELNIAYAN